MSEIIISLTTTSKRISIVNKTIYSLLNQKTNYKYTIRLYISKKGYLIDEGIKNIPIKLKQLTNKFSIFSIIYTNNLGSYRKLLPVLKEKWNQDVIIITVDDDKIYKKNMIDNLIKKYFENDKKSIIANRAFVKWNKYLSEFCKNTLLINNPIDKIIYKISKKKKIAQNSSYELSSEYDIINKISFLEGNDGVLYHTSFFNPIVLNWKIIKKIAKNHDDFWFKLCCLVNNVGVICINPFTNKKKRISSQIQNTQISGLHNNINKGSYNKEINNMCKWFLN